MIAEKGVVAIDYAFGTLCPRPEDLQTGDLLFPRPFDKVPVAWLPGAQASFAEQESASRPRPAPGILEAGLKRLLLMNELNQQQTWMGREESSRDELIKQLQALYFLKFLNAWFHLTGLEVLSQPKLRDMVEKVLSGAYSNGSGTDFLSGHVSLVIRENDRPYVIESNVTDFSHYRVAIHPYCAVGNKDGELCGQRGWIDHRREKDEWVWQCRPRHDTGAELSEADQAAIANEAKKLLGRPYGFFEDTAYGNDDRLYCGEFCDLVLKTACAVDVADCSTWDWMIANLPADNTFTADINAVLDENGGKIRDRVRGKPFFILTPKQMYRSSRARTVFQPRDSEGRQQEYDRLAGL